jgi:hypothetical protein
MAQRGYNGKAGDPSAVFRLPSSGKAKAKAKAKVKTKAKAMITTEDTESTEGAEEVFWKTWGEKD